MAAGCSSSSGGGGESAATDTAGSDTGATDTASGACTAKDLGGACNPLCASDIGCGEGQICTLNGQMTQCVTPGTQPVGKGCNEETTCAEGACVTAEVGGSKCRSFCKTDADCSAETQCGTLEGVENLGVCIPRPEGCSVFAQDCEDAAMACYADGCFTAGTGKLGEECSGMARCEKGLVCSEGGGSKMLCHEACNPNTGGPEPKCHLKCPGNFATLIDQDGKSLGVGVCQQDDMEDDCDLAAQNCPMGQACYWTNNKPRCRDAGTTAIGTMCSSDTECVKGAICWPVGTKCKAICNPADPLHDECEDSTTQCPQITANAGYCDE